MNHKTAVKIAIVMIVVFGLIVSIYPLIFSPQPPGDTKIDPGAPPVEGPPPVGP